MKKLSLTFKILLLLLPFVGISLFAKYGILGFASGDVPYFFWNKDYCNESHNNEVLILGDSTANAAYLPDYLSEKTVNLSLGGITPVETFYILKDYLEESQAPQDVFISFADYHFWWADFFWDYSVYSHRFEWKDYLEISNTAQEYEDEDIGYKNCYFDLLSYELYLPNKYITSIINAKFDGRLEENKASYDFIKNYSGSYYRRHTELPYGEEEFTEFTVEPLFKEYYCRIIQLCLDNGCCVHLVKLPLPPTSTYTKEYIELYDSFYETLKKEYPDITVDWFKDGYDASYFLDNLHLNEEGGKKFSVELKGKYPEAF